MAYAVWLYSRFPLSLRLVEEMLLERGIVVSYETILRWGRSSAPRTFDDCAGSGPAPMMFGTWTKSSSPSRQETLVGGLGSGRICSRRDRPEPPQDQGRQAPAHQATEQTWPGTKRSITGKLRSYGAAKRQVMPDVEHRAQGP